jgi:hypothetical protein
MDRSTLGKVGILMAALLAVLPMTWWLRSILIASIAAFACDLILRIPWIRRLPEAGPLKIYLSLCFLYLVLVLSWDPIRQQYLKEQQRHVFENLLSELKPEERAQPTKPTEEKLPEET